MNESFVEYNEDHKRMNKNRTRVIEHRTVQPMREGVGEGGGG